jgi:hypothetical protein
MKYGWVALLVVAGLVAPRAAKAQAEIYGEFSASVMANQIHTFTPFGGTAGILVDGPTLFHKVVVSADVQGRFVESSSLKLNGATVGPRFSVPVGHSLTPYGEFMVGFARLYSDGTYGTGLNGSTTDSTIQLNAGVEKKVSAHWDATVEYSYAQYFAVGGQFNPKTFSVGAVYHFVKR